MRSFLPHSPSEVRTKGLRDSENPGDCRIFYLRKDGSKGRLIRIVPPTIFDPAFTGRHKYGEGK